MIKTPTQAHDKPAADAPEDGDLRRNGDCADDCCVSPCDPPWQTGEQCMVWYEQKFFRIPIREQGGIADFARGLFIEFRITYEHRLCLLGKQHGPLAYTVTLLPGEKVNLYHSDRYRQITSAEQRFSVQTTFMQYFSAVHQARVTNTMDSLKENLTNIKGSTSVSVGGGLAGLLGGPSGSASLQTNVTDHNMLHVGAVSDQFNQSVQQSSQLTHAERSTVVSTYEDKETADITVRKIQNDNQCRAVTYFVRKIVEVYTFSTRVVEIVYRIVAPNVPQEWHTLDDVAWLPPQIQAEIKAALQLLPKVGQVIVQKRPITLPTDGLVYDPELAHCCSCEPQREAEIAIKLERQRAEMQLLRLEVERRRKLLDSGVLDPFVPAPAPAPGP
jgi:thermitase